MTTFRELNQQSHLLYNYSCNRDCKINQDFMMKWQVCLKAAATALSPHHSYPHYKLEQDKKIKFFSNSNDRFVRLSNDWKVSSSSGSSFFSTEFLGLNSVNNPSGSQLA